MRGRINTPDEKVSDAAFGREPADDDEPVPRSPFRSPDEAGRVLI
jgi:hypothetical protein